MVTALFGIAGGIFCIWAAYTRQEWFFRSPKAHFFVDHFGEDGARAFYIGLGIFLLVVSIMIMATV